jgi:hypothetical protein
LMLMKETVSIIYVVVPSKIIWINCAFGRLFSMPWDDVAFYFVFVKNTLFRLICNMKVHLNLFQIQKRVFDKMLITFDCNLFDSFVIAYACLIDRI